MSTESATVNSKIMFNPSHQLPSRAPKKATMTFRHIHEHVFAPKDITSQTAAPAPDAKGSLAVFPASGTFSQMEPLL